MVNTIVLEAVRASDMRTLVAAIERAIRPLDNLRLGRQRHDALRIHRALHGARDLAGHPAKRMWRGHARVLRLYMHVACREWARRGFRNNRPTAELAGAELPLDADYAALVAAPAPALPRWLADDQFAAQHRALLFWQDRRTYQAYEPDYCIAAKVAGSQRPAFVWPVEACEPTPPSSPCLSVASESSSLASTASSPSPWPALKLGSAPASPDWSALEADESSSPRHFTLTAAAAAAQTHCESPLLTSPWSAPLSPPAPPPWATLPPLPPPPALPPLRGVSSTA